MSAPKHSPEKVRKVAESLAVVAIGAGSAVLMVTNLKFRTAVAGAVAEVLQKADQLPSVPAKASPTPSTAPSPPQRRPQPPSGSPISGEGVVYMLKAGPFYKVGKAQNYDKRSRQIKLQMPFPVEDVHTISCADITHVERYWHKRFGARRANSEWFLLTDADVEEFKGYKRM